MQKNDSYHNNPNGRDSNGDMNGEDILHIGSRSFRRTKLGLAEEEVRSYIEELISQRDALAKRQEHLSVLTELAEKTVIEANNLSQLMKNKSAEQAKAEAEAVLLKAEKDSEQMFQTIKNEAKVVTEKETETLKSEALRQVQLMREQQLDSIRSEAASLAQKLQTDLFAQIDDIRKSIISFGTKFKAVESSGDMTYRAAATEKKDKPSAVLSDGEKGLLFDSVPWLEIEIMPPMDIEKVMDLISHLEILPEVKTTDLLPETPNHLIRVFLNKPLLLVDKLRALPQIAQVTEMFDVNGIDRQSGEKRERIQVTFGATSEKNSQTKKDTVVRSAY
jgi:hypothetical protein